MVPRNLISSTERDFSCSLSFPVDTSQPTGRISKLAYATPMRNLCETHEKTLRGHDEPPGGSKIITRCKGKHSETTTNDWRPTAPVLNPKLFVQNHLQRTTLGPAAVRLCEAPLKPMRTPGSVNATYAKPGVFFFTMRNRCQSHRAVNCSLATI